jgi:hypothetical protein
VVPPVPQLLEVVPVTHVPLAQQPPSQLVASHVAATQPPSWQLSVGQLVQAAPPPPQLLAEVPGWHCPVASQQPLGQLLALHALTQVLCGEHEPALQDSQVTPFFPQAVPLLPPRHTPLWQHPRQVAGPQALSHV